ncbi:uncharacterized protein MEPE_00157 [Melanopsichium pennsylvanicum]|uniref:FAS1 domain-containing protein n=2 Tax=Melanopsichium pennsylvanicum TaxID=63383 RepID=A0AAJ5C2F9_9BASI|nr:putative protein [Melanopsichium pennsylvanicum 4]SNX81452.1 uncharacterized protein MEPE_00157 [Melanopsichium pennsylvanicum]
MKISFSVLALATLAAQSVFATQFQNLQLRQGGDANALLQGLRDNNLTSLANVLSQHPTVTDRILADSSEKLLLAPTDEAISKLPSWVTSNSSRLEATLLQHVLRGSFDVEKLNAYPLHTIGHSLLNETGFSKLPGGAGQAVALSKSGDKMFVAEAVNNDTFVQSSHKFENITIQAINQAITVPGSVTETLRFLGYTGISTLLQNVQNGALARTIDSMSGITLFVPTNDAINKFVATQPNPQDIPTILGQHIVASRVVYSPLLIDQGSLISSSGQDIVFDNNAGTVKVGNTTALILQTDVIAQQGVVHLIDNVLASTALDTGRAAQAQKSAQESVDAQQAQQISGPVSGKNAITTQGTDVPAAQEGSGANNRSANDNTDTAGSGQTESAIGNGTNGNNGGTSQANSSSSNGSNDSNGNGSNIDHRDSNGADSTRRLNVAGGAVFMAIITLLIL